MCMYLNLVGALYLNPMYTSIATPDGQQLRKITPPDPNPIPHVPKQFLSRDGRIINLIRAWLPARRTKPNGGAHNTAHPPSQERPWKKRVLVRAIDSLLVTSYVWKIWSRWRRKSEESEMPWTPRCVVGLINPGREKEMEEEEERRGEPPLRLPNLGTWCIWSLEMDVAF